MEAIITILVLGAGLSIALVIWLIIRAISAGNRIEELTGRVELLRVKIARIEARFSPDAVRPGVPKPAEPHETGEQPAMRLEARPGEAPVAAQSPAGPQTRAEASGRPGPELQTDSQAAAAPPLLSTRPREAILATALPVASPAPPKPMLPKINWEQFMGVKGFAWLGGLALFLGVAFFVKYSFDNNLISPQLRVAMGFLTGLGLMAGGVMLQSRKQYIIGSQTLCATGVVVLYAVTFASRAHYHFLEWPGVWWDALPAFTLMALITATGFLLSVRLNALVVAILGMLGGFMTPVLLSTGKDNPLGLFGYIAILNAGLIFVALNRRWHFLAALAALGTAIMQIGWAGEFFTSEKYFEGNKILIPLAVLAGFNAFFLAANWLARRRGQTSPWLSGAHLGLAFVALSFTLYFFGFTPLAGRPVLLFSFVFAIDVGVAALTRLDQRLSAAQPAAGMAVFGILALWTTQHLTGPLLNAALAFYLIFALFHSALPAWRLRACGVASGPASRLQHLFPPLALLLVLVPLFRLEEFSFLVWPYVLLVDLLAIGLAVLSATLVPVLVVLLLTLAATGALVFKTPAELAVLPSSFFLIGAFAVFFVSVSVWLARRFKPDVFKSELTFGGDISSNEALASLLPACSAALPFLLLIMTVLRLPLANPAPVFALAALLAVLLLGLTRLFSYGWMPLIALAGVFALECAWHFNRLDLANPNLMAPALLLVWYLVFFGIFASFPFLFLKRFADKPLIWAAAALAGPAQFLLIYRLAKVAWPNAVMGLLPALFAVPALLSLVAVLRAVPDGKQRMTLLAWFGGVALFFVTLIFPIQFNRQWITLGWGLEGAALLWLFHRVPHPGLRLTGVGLLIASFARLAFNPAVLEYHARSATPIFNWYLYTYGLVTASLFLGARLLAPPRHLVLQSNARAVLASLGTVLAFLLLNIEIADYFSAPGSTLTFQFSGDFARDMTYSIAWAVFALVLLVTGISRQIAAARYAGMALLCMTLLKLFLHDLARLGTLYRVGALFGVAIIAILASFAYQKFFSAAATAKETKDENDK